MLTWKPRSKAVLNAKSIRNLRVRCHYILGIGLILSGSDYIFINFAGPLPRWKDFPCPGGCSFEMVGNHGV